MLRQVLQWFKLKITNKKKQQKAEEYMATKTMKLPRAKVSSAEFNKHSTVGEIKRIGKNVVIVDNSGSLIPISQKYVKSLKASALRNRRSAIIKVNGLSRAQIGRVVGDFKEDPSVGVYIRKIPTQKTNKPKATNFEILLMDGNANEEE